MPSCPNPEPIFAAMSSSSTIRHISVRAVLASAVLFFSTGCCKYIVPNAQPEMTGTVHFPGFRLDRPWPGDWDGELPLSSWSLQLNVSRDVRKWWPSFTTGKSDNTMITAQLVAPPPDTPGSFVSMTKNGPSNNVNATRSWRVSMMAFRPEGLDTVADANDAENGTCPTSVVSKDCADLVKLQIRGSIPVMHANEPKVSLNSTICPVLASAGCDINTLDLRHDRFNVSATTVWQYQQERYPDAYSKYVAHTIPIVVVWGHSGDVRGGEQLDGSALAADHVQILCVKADSSSMMVVVNIWTAGLAILMATAWAGFGGL